MGNARHKPDEPDPVQTWLRNLGLAFSRGRRALIGPFGDRGGQIRSQYAELSDLLTAVTGIETIVAMTHEDALAAAEERADANLLEGFGFDGESDP